MKQFFKDWCRVINFELLQNTLEKINKISNNTTLIPPQKDVFRAFKECPYNNLKVVIINQIPYIQKDLNIGMAFGNPSQLDDSLIHPVLKLIKNCVLSPNYDNTNYIFDKSLKSWANQGVLLLNTSLTIEINKEYIHKYIWKNFIINLVQNISKDSPHVVFLLFGRDTKLFIPNISKFSVILEYEHPMDALLENRDFICDGFEKVNKILTKNNNFKINWYEPRN